MILAHLTTKWRCKFVDICLQLPGDKSRGGYMSGNELRRRRRGEGLFAGVPGWGGVKSQRPIHP